MDNETKVLKKKKGIIVIIVALLVIAAAVGIGLAIYNTPANRLLRQLDLGQRYLEEQNYEQAIVAFDKAIEIDPMNERAYIGKAQAYTGMGDYEQAAATYAAAVQNIPDGNEVWSAAEQFYLDYAQIYINNGDLGQAASILEEGYNLLGSGRLKDKLEELQAQQKQQQEEQERKLAEEQSAGSMVVFPFDFQDITVNGYNLQEDYFAEMRKLYPTGEGYDMGAQNDVVIKEDGLGIGDDYYHILNRTYQNGGTSQELVTNKWWYIINYSSWDSSPSEARLIVHDYYSEYNMADYPELNVPITPGSSYEDWCNIMQVAQIKENGREAERDGDMFTIPEEGEYMRYSFGAGESKCWVFTTDEYRVIYTESSYDLDIWCELRFEASMEYSLEKWGRIHFFPYTIFVRIGADGIINEVIYSCML